jgi:hypothetical protein
MQNSRVSEQNGFPYANVFFDVCCCLQVAGKMMQDVVKPGLVCYVWTEKFEIK